LNIEQGILKSDDGFGLQSSLFGTRYSTLDFFQLKILFTLIMKAKLITAFMLTTTLLAAQNGIERPLYERRIPNSRSAPDPEKVDKRPNGTRFILWTALPTLTVFVPEKHNGQAVVICPGGGYRGTAIDHEGLDVAKALNANGIAAFVLKYRTPNDTTNIDKSLVPLQDAQEAIRYVRKNAAQYNINPAKIGIMGFSAGGHLAATAATHFDKNADHEVPDTTSVRPDFAILIYPVISFSDSLTHGGSRQNLLGKKPSEAYKILYSNELQVSPQSPPAFLVHSQDDKTVKVENSVAYYLACQRNGVLAEMHLYPKGGHGFGMDNKTTSDKWFDRLVNWLKTL
jgi:acetyl esterase/lipase